MMETEAYKALTDYRHELLSTKQKTQDNTDKYIITLSGGAIGITISFFKDISIDEGVLLLIAWVCWVLSILMALYSMSTSIKAHEKTVSLIDEGIRNNNDLMCIYDHIDKKVTNSLDKNTRRVNLAAKIFFLFGFIVVAFFMFTFLSQKQIPSMANIERKVIAQDGQTVRPVPPVPNSNIVKKGQTVSPPPPKPPQTPTPPPTKK